ncbi:hypothetical protein OIY81_2387 [Cryptosporidium canis]|uniref:BRCT domain-containing protein n=1 Tax=Cryptosporidium canis TaxID=195482 RepID=A0ABQ8P544_9CRYT|nr:hypothetical protein OJ252_2458 [Cryptosporidium canis]KAJ1609358.1 hypothetical protein OIY81_2387 [Cryptosporidium canis]
MSSGLWSGKTFLLSGFDDRGEYVLIKDKYIESNGGRVLEEGEGIRDDDVDYLVCNYSVGYRHRISSIDYNKLRTPFWVWLSVHDEWNYALEWHPFFRPNGKFAYGILSGFNVCLRGYSVAVTGLDDREESPRYIRKLSDVGILASFIETQMGGRVVFDREHLADGEEDIVSSGSSEESSKVKSGGGANLTIVCDGEMGDPGVLASGAGGFQTVVSLDWLFDCYDEGRVLSYKKYGLQSSRSEPRESSVMEREAEDGGCRYRVIVSHQVFLRHREVYDALGRICSDDGDIEIGRPSREVIKYIESQECSSETKTGQANTRLVLMFNDSLEEQDFWFDLLNTLEESAILNIQLLSRERRDRILGHLQRIRVVNDPEDLFCESPESGEITPVIGRLGSVIGYSVPSYISDLLVSETSGFLDTVLKFTDLENITGLNSFVEYSNDNPTDIVHLSRLQAIKRFDSFEKEYSSSKFS